MFFGRSEGWSEDDGWETIEAAGIEEASQAFAKKWDLDDGDKFSVIRAEGERLEFVAQKRLAVSRLPLIPPIGDEGPDSQR